MAKQLTVREMASRGGHARAKKLGVEKCRESARKAGQASATARKARKATNEREISD
jgi:hypothetical protein